ncbi:DUF4974 domain-containing protein [Flavobacteriaceae bacterium AU392]|nr:FecR family protein [Flavobacteriaceae bacterium]RKM82937.1 DUF4974 domain-containing protein [Flavobacteriaceae bacterium AU392]
MKREELIKKWLDNELTPQEFEAFNALEDVEFLKKLSNNVKQFKAPEYDTSEELDKLFSKTKPIQLSSRNWIKPLLRVAAILTICFSIYYYTTTLDSDTNITTLVAQKTKVILPDASKVEINALSDLTFNKNTWGEERTVSLDGEAYFKVAKGSTFNVNTPSGIITVLGTQFNVKHRDDIFEVICYEGSVGVSYNSTTVTLKPGETFLIIDGNNINIPKENIIKPSWINNRSNFKSLPFKYVINEFERQYNVTINVKNIDVNELYTGHFFHNDINHALKSITLPLNLKHNSENNSNVIVLTRE